MLWKIIKFDPLDSPNILMAMAKVRQFVRNHSPNSYVYLDPVHFNSDFANVLKSDGEFLGVVSDFPGGPAVKIALCQLANSGEVPVIHEIAAAVHLPVTSPAVQEALAQAYKQFLDFRHLHN